MKKILTLLFAIFTGYFAFCQNDISDPQNKKVITQQDAYYKGGEEKLYIDIMKLVKFPEELKGKELIGDIMLNFDIMKDGTVANIIKMKGVEPLLDQAIIDAVKLLTFEPTIQNGLKMKTPYFLTLPIRMRKE